MRIFICFRISIPFQMILLQLFIGGVIGCIAGFRHTIFRFGAQFFSKHRVEENHQATCPGYCRKRVRHRRDRAEGEHRFSRRIADPANLQSDNPAIKAAAKAKAEQDLAPQKIKAIKYLATVGCAAFPTCARA